MHSEFLHLWVPVCFYYLDFQGPFPFIYPKNGMLSSCLASASFVNSTQRCSKGSRFELFLEESLFLDFLSEVDGAGTNSFDYFRSVSCVSFNMAPVVHPGIALFDMIEIG